MKKVLLIIPIFLLLFGCSNKVEDNKFAYLEYKNNLEKQEKFIDNDGLDFNTFFDIDRDGDIVKYSLNIYNPKIDMHKVKALLIHNYDNVDVYPSIGIFDEPQELLVSSNDNIRLEGTILSADDLSDIEFKLYLEYLNKDDEIEKIYYEVQRG